MPGARKGAVQIRFEILEYLYFAPSAQPRRAREAVNAADLMALSKGQTTTMECLRVEYYGKVKTTIYDVYKITVGDSTAEAILPVNISPATN